MHFAIGYSEPEAGTDLASLRTTAVRHGDEYIVNGQKIFTTGGHDADYIWLACRTDPEAVKHKGISILIVDTTDPGYSWTPIILSDGAHHTNATYYNDVRVPADMLVGEENGGWRLITTQLNHERVMLGPAGRIAGIYDRVHEWASKPGGDGVTPLDHDDVARARRDLRDVADQRAAELAGRRRRRGHRRGRCRGDEGLRHRAHSDIGRLAEEIVGKYGDPAEPDTAELLDWLDSQTKRNLVITFGGGVNEVMREMIAAVGPQGAEGAAMTTIADDQSRQQSRDQGAGDRQAARRPGSGEPADDQQLGRGASATATRSTSTRPRPAPPGIPASSPRRR